MEEVRCLLWLLMVFGAGSARIWDVLRLYKSPQNAVDMLQHSQAAGKMQLKDSTLRRVRQTTLEQADAIIANCQKLDQTILTYLDKSYPEQLLALVNPPVLLFCQGDVSLLQHRLLLTVVGTRKPTEYSLKVERKICSDLAAEGFVLVTGFAVGCDITANLCAMEKNAPSIAVMGCGLDVRYPQAHANLKTDLVKNGLIFSEFLPGTMPSPGNFPVRNRVLAGLTNGTFVIQAPERSGALITAEDALESGRDVFCIPPADVFDKRYAGVIKYLRDGAVPVFDSRDILYAYYTDYSSYITASVLYGENQEKSESLVMELGKPEKKRNASRSAIRKEADTAAETEPANLSDSVSEEESRYRDLLQAFEPAEVTSEEPAGETEVPIPSTEDSVHDQILARIRKNGTCHLDEIAADTSLSIEELAMLLTELELMGKIQRMPGKRYQAL